MLRNKLMCGRRQLRPPLALVQLGLRPAHLLPLFAKVPRVKGRE